MRHSLRRAEIEAPIHLQAPMSRRREDLIKDEKQKTQYKVDITRQSKAGIGGAQRIDYELQISLYIVSLLLQFKLIK